jgi:hypothetical protein
LRAYLIVIPFVLAGCGSFPLGTAYPTGGQTHNELQLDVLVCQDRAQKEANTAERQAASFVAGLTIIGAPFAIEAERAKQREVWQQCMREKGYTVKPPE